MIDIKVKSKVIAEQKYSSSEKDSDDNYPRKKQSRTDFLHLFI